jgi:colicin import membrane protein
VRSGGWRRALLYALAVHLLLFTALFVSLRWTVRPGDEQTIVSATLVEEGPAARRASPEPEPVRQPPVKKPEPAPSQEQEKQRHRKEQERQLKQKQVEAENQRRRDAERRQREARAELSRQLAAEEQGREEAARAARRQASADRHLAVIVREVMRRWHRPPGLPKGLRCTMRVRLGPGGEVLQVVVVKSSGNFVFDESAVKALEKAPLPMPEDKTLANLFFRELTFVFAPED